MVRKVHFIFFQLLVDSKKGRKKERKKKEKEKKVQIRFPVYQIILRQLPQKKKKKNYITPLVGNLEKRLQLHTY